MKQKKLTVVIAAVMGLSLGVPSYMLGQEQGVTDAATEQQQIGSEQPSGNIMNMAASELKAEPIYNEVSSENMRLADAARQEQQTSQPVAADTPAADVELAAFEALDADSDGFIGRQESGLSRPLAEKWLAVDIDSDGQIDETEFSAFEAGYSAHVRARQGTQSPSRRQSGMAQQPQSRDSQELARFSELDENDDGYLSEQEAEGHERLVEDWEQADTNNDGHVDPVEFSAFESAIRPERSMQRQRPEDRPPSSGMGQEQNQ
ncbi:hypothetical protein [Thiohalomonas denitrificans]|uniref:hypothetical protein n=1 Tax=Thiohalomonas denitrificans TaxID=415747 RepID=UPI0026F0F1C6|nr:hypothetical protein [Thiohalomonas denitrificans]